VASDRVYQDMTGMPKVHMTSDRVYQEWIGCMKKRQTLQMVYLIDATHGVSDRDRDATDGVACHSMRRDIQDGERRDAMRW